MWPPTMNICSCAKEHMFIKKHLNRVLGMFNPRASLSYFIRCINGISQ